MLSAQIDGNFSLEPMVMFLMFSLSRCKLYSPGPGLCDWLKIDTDLQSSLPGPMVMPDLGLFWKSDERVYLSGEGTDFFLPKN